jgi:hypothetical protein
VSGTAGMRLHKQTNKIQLRYFISDVRKCHKSPDGCQFSDSSNTPIIYDGIDFTVQAYSGQLRVALSFSLTFLACGYVRCKPIEIVNKWIKTIGSFRNVIQEGSTSAGYFFGYCQI